MSPVTGVFPAQLSAVISLFPWNPIKAEPKVAPLSLGNTVGLRKIDWSGEGAEESPQGEAELCPKSREVWLSGAGPTAV